MQRRHDLCRPEKRERTAIAKFVADSAIHVISEEQFAANGYKTDVSKNEYVLFTSKGVYMQIIRNGCGEKIKDGETATVLCRFTEKNILTDSVQLTNDILYYGSIVDKMNVTNNSGTFTASFINGESLCWHRMVALPTPLYCLAGLFLCLILISVDQLP